MSARRDAVVDDLRTLASDLRSLVESATTDPKERRRKELQWRALYTGLGVVTVATGRSCGRSSSARGR